MPVIGQCNRTATCHACVHTCTLTECGMCMRCYRTFLQLPWLSDFVNYLYDTDRIGLHSILLPLQLPAYKPTILLT